jgi:UPF0755 protein
MKLKLSRPLLITISIAALLLVVLLYLFLFHSSLKIEKPVSFYIFPKESTETALSDLKTEGKVGNMWKIKFILDKLGVGDTLPVGHYKLKPGMSDFRIARTLKGGIQTPVRITFNNIRTVDQLAGRLSKQLLADSVSILNSFRDTVWIRKAGFTPYNYMCIFIPNTYETWWNTSPEKLLSLFKREYDNFWNGSHMDNAKKIRLTPAQVSTLASIVEEETNKSDEMPKVAGLYMNRLRIDMPLQADPTIKFAVGDFTIKRILKGHTLVKSPYNTYKYVGLPPGPIRIPSIKAIEAVLFYEKHSYLYMCAKSDFSGYHAFATTLSQHNKNASDYHDALNSKGILE